MSQKYRKKPRRSSRKRIREPQGEILGIDEAAVQLSLPIVEILAGERFDQKIQRELEDSKSVVVIWSDHAVRSDWVLAEADEGRRRGILVPVLLEDVTLPLAFRMLHSESLVGWNGEATAPAFKRVVSAISALLGSDSKESPRELIVLRTSTQKTTLRPTRWDRMPHGSRRSREGRTPLDDFEGGGE